MSINRGNRVHIGDISTAIILDTGEDISSATVTDIKYKKPDGATGTWTGALYGTTSVKYETQVGDLDQLGRYEIQAYIEMPTWEGRGNKAHFIVYPNLKGYGELVLDGTLIISS